MPDPTAIPPFGNPNSHDPLVRHPRHAICYLRYLAGQRTTPPPSAHDTPADQARQVERAVDAMIERILERR
jgi:hypothetical protein